MSSINLFCVHIIVLLLYHIGSPTIAYKTIDEPPNNECSLYYSDYTDWTISSETGKFLDETDNLYWIITANPTQQQRWLFTANTEYKFISTYPNILLTIDINGNFNQSTEYFISNINPKFFISDDSTKYIGISFGKYFSKIHI